MPRDTPKAQSTASPGHSSKGPWRVAVSLLLAVGVVGLLATQVSGRDFAALWANLIPPWIALGLCAYLLQTLVRGIRLWVMTRAAASPVRLAALSAAQALLLVVLPLRTGEISYVALLARQGGVGASWASKILVAVRLLDLSAVSLLFGVAVLVPGSVPEGLRAAVPLAALTFALPLGLLLWPRLVARLLRVPVMWLMRRPIVRSLPGAGKVGGFLDRVLEISEPGWFRATLPKLAGLTLALWATNALMAYACLHGLGLAVDLTGALYMSTVLVLSSVLPIHGFAGFGPQDAIGAGLLMSLGFSREVAISGKLAWHVLILLFSGLAGLVGWFVVSADYRGQEAEVPAGERDAP